MDREIFFKQSSFVPGGRKDPRNRMKKSSEKRSTDMAKGKDKKKSQDKKTPKKTLKEKRKAKKEKAQASYS